jgi:hypothetical protein
MRNYFTSEALQEPSFRNFIFAPLMGLAFLMFLPFIGFYLTAQALLLKMESVAQGFMSDEVAVGNAYLTGSRDGTKLPESDTDLDAIEKEVLDRRKQKK